MTELLPTKAPSFAREIELQTDGETDDLENAAFDRECVLSVDIALAATDFSELDQ